jgi:hypothetical protein
MIVKTMAVRSMFVAAALSAFAVSANAFVLGFDPQIAISRAIDSPTLTVRYTGAAAALVELRVNGTSLGTRTVSSPKDAGETNFTLSMGDLHGGDNDVEIRLFDRTGKLLGKDHTNISVAAAQNGPVYLQTPKTGETVRGPIELKLGFDHDLKDCYVSFFVDGSFKTLSNSPPFTYTWDTLAETNGWHELEAWAIDNENETHKTGKIRVFVNNSGGYTNRVGVNDNVDLAPTKNLPADFVIGHPKSARKVVLKTGRHSFRRGLNDLQPLPAAAPAILADTVLSPAAQAKPSRVPAGIAMGVRNMLPTHKRLAHLEPTPIHKLYSQGAVASIEVHHPIIVIERHHDAVEVGNSTRVAMISRVKKTQIGSVTRNVTEATGLIRILKGSRLPNLSSFAIALDSDFVDFHGVLPRVDDGVPMTPLRFLLEKKGGTVDWNNPTKTVYAKADGNDLLIHIGDRFALINRGSVKLERSSYLDRGRTVVPLSFMESALHVNIQYDKHSNHMLITSKQ